MKKKIIKSKAKKHSFLEIKDDSSDYESDSRRSEKEIYEGMDKGL